MLLAPALRCLLAAGAASVSVGGAGELPGDMWMAEADPGRSAHLPGPNSVSAMSSGASAGSSVMVNGMQARLAKLRDDLETLKAKNARQAADNEAERRRQQEEPPLDDRRAELARKEAALHRDGGAERAAALDDLDSEIRGTKRRLEGARPRVQSKLTMLAQEKERAQGELLKAEKEAHAMNELMDGADTQASKISTRMALLPKQVKAFQRKINAEIKTRDEMLEQIPQLRQQVNDHYRRNNRTLRQLAASQDYVRSVGAEAQRLRKRLPELDRRLDNFEMVRSDVNESWSEVERLRDKQAALLGLKRRLEAQAGELSQTIASLAGEMDPISVETKRAQGRLRQSRNLLRLLQDSRADVHAKASRAVEQTLAEFAKLYNDLQQAIGMGGASRET